MVTKPAEPFYLDGVCRVVITVEVLNGDVGAIHGARTVGLPLALQLVLWRKVAHGDPWSPPICVPRGTNRMLQMVGELQVPEGTGGLSVSRASPDTEVCTEAKERYFQAMVGQGSFSSALSTQAALGTPVVPPAPRWTSQFPSERRCPPL